MECQDCPFKSNLGNKYRNGCNLRMLSSLNVLIYVILSAREVYGRGRLIEPVQRSSLWERGFDSPRNDDDTGLNCGGSWVQHGVNNGKCGICGDRYDVVPRANEPGGKYAKGIIVNKYTSNDNSILVVVEILSFLGGYFEFRICPNNNPHVPVTQECLDSNHLLIRDAVNNNPSYRYFPEEIGLQRLRVEIPTRIVCTQCVLQWKWHTAKDWGRCLDGSSRLGCGPQEEFYNCADISIEPASDFNINLNITDQFITSETTNKINKTQLNADIGYQPYTVDSIVSMKEHLSLDPPAIYEADDVRQPLQTIKMYDPLTQTLTNAELLQKTIMARTQQTTESNQPEMGVVESMFIVEEQSNPLQTSVMTSGIPTGNNQVLISVPDRNSSVTFLDTKKNMFSSDSSPTSSEVPLNISFSEKQLNVATSEMSLNVSKSQMPLHTATTLSTFAHEASTENDIIYGTDIYHTIEKNKNPTTPLIGTNISEIVKFPTESLSQTEPKPQKGQWSVPLAGGISLQAFALRDLSSGRLLVKIGMGADRDTTSINTTNPLPVDRDDLSSKSNLSFISSISQENSEADKKRSTTSAVISSSTVTSATIQSKAKKSEWMSTTTEMAPTTLEPAPIRSEVRRTITEMAPDIIIKQPRLDSSAPTLNKTIMSRRRRQVMISPSIDRPRSYKTELMGLNPAEVIKDLAKTSRMAEHTPTQSPSPTTGITSYREQRQFITQQDFKQDGQNEISKSSLSPAITKTKSDLIRQLEEAMSVIGNDTSLSSQNVISSKRGISGSTDFEKQEIQASVGMEDQMFNTMESSTFFDKSASKRPIKNIADINYDSHSASGIESQMFETASLNISTNTDNTPPFDKKVSTYNTEIYHDKYGGSNKSNLTGVQIFDTTGISQSQFSSIGNSQTASSLLMHVMPGDKTENNISANSQVYNNVELNSLGSQATNGADNAFPSRPINREVGSSPLLGSETNSAVTSFQKSPRIANIHSMVEYPSVLSSSAIVSSMPSTSDSYNQSSDLAIGNPTILHNNQLTSSESLIMSTDPISHQQGVNTDALSQGIKADMMSPSDNSNVMSPGVNSNMMSQADIDLMMNMLNSGQMNISGLEQYLNPAIFEKTENNLNTVNTDSGDNVTTFTSASSTDSMNSMPIKSPSKSVNSISNESSLVPANAAAILVKDKSILITEFNSGASSSASNTANADMIDKSALLKNSDVSTSASTNLPEAKTNEISPTERLIDHAETISLVDLLNGSYNGETPQQNPAIYNSQSLRENTGLLANVLGAHAENAQTDVSFTPIGQIGQGVEFSWANPHSGSSSKTSDNWFWDPYQQRWSETNTGSNTHLQLMVGTTAAKQEAVSGDAYELNNINKPNTNDTQSHLSQHILTKSAKVDTSTDYAVFSALPAVDQFVFQSLTTTNFSLDSSSNAKDNSLANSPTQIELSQFVSQSNVDSSFPNNASRDDRHILANNIKILPSSQPGASRIGLLPVVPEGMQILTYSGQNRSTDGQMPSDAINATSADSSRTLAILQQTNKDKVDVSSIMTEKASQSTSAVDPKPTRSTLLYNKSQIDTTTANPPLLSKVDVTGAVGRPSLQEQSLLEQERQTRIDMQRLMEQHKEETRRMEQQKNEYQRQLNEAKQQIEYEKRELVLRKQQLELEALRTEQLRQQQFLEDQRKQIEQERLRMEQERIRAAEEVKLKTAEIEKRHMAELDIERQKVIAAETERLRQEQARMRAAEEEERKRTAEAEQARLIAEQQAKARAEEEAKLRQEHLANIRAEEEARLKVEEQNRLMAGEEVRRLAEEQARKDEAATKATGNATASFSEARPINDTVLNQTDSSFTPIGSIGGIESQYADAATIAAWQAYLLASQDQPQIGSATQNKGSSVQLLQTNALSQQPQILNPAWLSVVPTALQQQQSTHLALTSPAMPTGLAALGLDAALLIRLLQQKQIQHTTSAPPVTTSKPELSQPRVPIRPDPQTRDFVRNMFLNNMGPGVDPVSILVGLTPEILMKSGVNPLVANSGDLSRIVPAVERALGITLNSIPSRPGQMFGTPGGLLPLAMGDPNIHGGTPQDRAQARRQFMLQQRMMTEMMQLLGIGPEPLEPGDPGYRAPGATAGRGGGGLHSGGGVGGSGGSMTAQLEMLGL